MIRIIIFILIGFLLLTFALMTVSYDTFTSILPGWHTTVRDTTIVKLLFYAWIAFIAALYYTLYKRNISISKSLFTLFILCTLPILTIAITMSISQFNQNNIGQLISLTKYLSLSIPLYFIGQLLFLYQLIEIFKKQKAQLR